MSTLYPANYSIIATPSKFVAFLLGDTTVNLKYIPSSYFLISITINFPIFPSLHVCFKHFEDLIIRNHDSYVKKGFYYPSSTCSSFFVICSYFIFEYGNGLVLQKLKQIFLIIRTLFSYYLQRIE